MSISNNAAILFGIAGFLMGGIGVYYAADAKRTADDMADTISFDSDAIEGLAEQTRGATESMQAVNKRVSGIQSEERQLRDKVRELIGQMNEMSRKLDALQGARGGAGPAATPHAGQLTSSQDEANARDKEFGDRFLRIHRNALVALDRIAALEKDSDGRVVIRLDGTDRVLEVSRRNLPAVRRVVKSL